MDAYLHDSVGKPKRASAYMESAWAEHATTSNKKLVSFTCSSSLLSFLLHLF